MGDGGRPRTQVCGQGLVIAAFNERADDLRPRPERRCAATLPAATPQDSDPSLKRASRQVLREPRLADPGFSSDEEQATPTAGRVLQGDRQLRHFPIPADEGSPSRPGRIPNLTHRYRSA